MATESRIYCDCCGEAWEKGFFCPNCSHRVRVRQELVPNLMWDGLPSDAMVWEDVHDFSGDICLNCCTCHYRPTPPMLSDLLGIAPNALAGEPSEIVVARIRSAWNDDCRCDLQDTPDAPTPPKDLQDGD